MGALPAKKLRFVFRTVLATVSLAMLAQTGALARDKHRKQAEPPRPNLVIFLADDLGNDLPPWGDTNARAPNIASWRRSGLAFDRAFVASPACAPSRAALLTG
jgi:N-sulfoglucosamine sulfohydrolase